MKVHSNNIPQSVEYRGMSEWGVHWNVQEDTEYIVIGEEDPTIKHYVYDEWIFDQEPNYDMFVSRYIRQRYTPDQEAALKSNMIQNLVDGKSADKEWQDFENYRNEAKKIGREIFGV